MTTEDYCTWSSKRMTSGIIRLGTLLTFSLILLIFPKDYCQLLRHFIQYFLKMFNHKDRMLEETQQMTVENTPVNCCVMTENDQNELLEFMGKKYTLICQKAQKCIQNGGMRYERELVQYIISLLEVGAQNYKVAQKRLQFLQMLDPKIGFNEMFMSNKFNQYTQEAISQIIVGNKPAIAPSIRTLNLLCRQYMKSPQQCLKKMKQRRYVQKAMDSSINYERIALEKIINQYLKANQGDLQNDIKQMAMLLTDASIAFATKLQRFILLEEKLNKLFTIKMFQVEFEKSAPLLNYQRGPNRLNNEHRHNMVGIEGHVSNTEGLNSFAKRQSYNPQNKIEKEKTPKQDFARGQAWK